MEVRARLPRERILDVRLADLKRDPVGTVRSIYRYFALEWNEDLMVERIRAHLQKQASHAARRSSKHVYSAEQFGLDAAELREEFSSYESVFLGAPDRGDLPPRSFTTPMGGLPSPTASSLAWE
jgi:hypothetical protein